MSHDTPPDEQGDPTIGFLDRMRKLTETNASALYNLYEKEGPSSQAFQDRLDDIVFDIAFSDKDYAANAVVLRENKLKPEAAEQLAAKQRDTVAAIREMVINETGLPTEELATDIQKAQAAVVERLQGMDMNEVDSNELLRRIGILHEDGKGVARFTYPKGLFPPKIDEKWELYMATVSNDLEMTRALRGGFGSQDDTTFSDNSRRFAHNRIANDLDKILGFDKLPDSDWDFEQTRRLVAKMREAQFEGQQTGESARTGRMVARGIGALGLSVLGKLAERTNDSTTR